MSREKMRIGPCQTCGGYGEHKDCPSCNPTNPQEPQTFSDEELAAIERGKTRGDELGYVPDEDSSDFDTYRWLATLRSRDARTKAAEEEAQRQIKWSLGMDAENDELRAKVARLREALLNAPMPKRETVLNHEQWTMKYEDWYDANAAADSALLTETDPEGEK